MHSPSSVHSVLYASIPHSHHFNPIIAPGRCGHGSGIHSPSLVHSIPYASVPHSHRFNPIAVPATHSAAKTPRRKSHNDDSDEDDNDFQPMIAIGNTTDVHHETIHHQCIKSEQRHHDELCDSYCRLKDALSVSDQKSSKVSLLNRASTHVKYLEMTIQQLQTRLQQAKNEVERLCMCVSSLHILLSQLTPIQCQ